MAFDASQSAAIIEHPAITRQQLYRSCAGLVSRLIAIMDDLDGDTDLEPTLCHSGAFGSDELDDLEAEHDGREPDVDDEPDYDGEPSLCGTVGTPERHAVGGQTAHFGIDTVDLEEGCEDEGFESDREPCVHD